MNGRLWMCAVVLGAAVAVAQDPTATGTGQLHKQENAHSATKDTSATSGDQVTQPTGAKSSTVIGCLSEPDADGHFTIHSMQFRSGVEVVGPNDLGIAAGKKVKLTGAWEKAADAASPAAKRFQASSLEVMADKCSVPAETNPVSKQKEKKKQK